MLPIRNTQTWLPNIFNDFFDNDWINKANTTVPAINVAETDNDYRIEVAAPGMTKDDFNVHIDDNSIVIRIEKKEEKEDKKNERYLRKEFSYTTFQQALLLPDDVDKKNIAAHVEHGVLQIDLPKLPQEPVENTTRQIEIK